MGIIIKQTNVQNGGGIIFRKNIIGGIAYDGNIIYKARPKVEIVDFTTGTDEQIASMLEAHYRGDINIEDYWKVGDTRLIHLNGIASPNVNEYTNAWQDQDITIVITTLNHYELKEKIGIRDKAAITCQTREVLNNLTQSYNENGCIYVNLNSDNDKTFKKWAQLPMRTWLNEKFLNNCFSIKMQNMIKETKHKRLSQFYTEPEEVIDKIFLPSYTEVYGNVKYLYYYSNITPADTEGTQWDYYKISNNRIKKGNNNGIANNHNCYWWTGSTSSNYNSSEGYCWLYVSGDGNIGWYYGRNSYGLAPAFCL